MENGQHLQQKPRRDSSRIHFIRCIPAHHVHDRFVATGMIFEPWVDLQDLAIDDNDSVAICNQAFDLPPGENRLAWRHYE